LQAPLGTQTVRLGKRSWLAEGSRAAVINAAPPTEAGFSEVWVATDGLVGRVLLRDDIRPEARAVVETLRTLGLRSVVLTGDHKATGEHLRQQLHVDEVRSELKPEQKVEAIRSFTREHHRVAMIGDGVNDAPALAAADLGIAMGTGTDVAMESGGITLVKGDLTGILRARKLSQATMRNIRQNLFFAFIYNAIGVPIAAGVLYPFFGILLSPILAAAAMSLSSVSVITNALRLRKVKL
jgi:Cu+-exporting ATPase